MNENMTRFLKRLSFIAFLLIIHYLFIFLPIMELFLIYLIFFKPKWFQDF